MLTTLKHMIESRLTKARRNVVRIKPPIVYLQLFSEVCLGCNAVLFRYGVWRIIRLAFPDYIWSDKMHIKRSDESLTCKGQLGTWRNITPENIN